MLIREVLLAAIFFLFYHYLQTRIEVNTKSAKMITSNYYFLNFYNTYNRIPVVIYRYRRNRNMS